MCLPSGAYGRIPDLRCPPVREAVGETFSPAKCRHRAKSSKGRSPHPRCSLISPWHFCSGKTRTDRTRRVDGEHPLSPGASFARESVDVKGKQTGTGGGNE